MGFFSVAQITKIIARSTVEQSSTANQMTRSRRWQAKETCFNVLSEYCQRRCRCHAWWKTIPEVGAGNWKKPFANGGKVEPVCSFVRSLVSTELLPHDNSNGENRRWNTYIRV